MKKLTAGIFATLLTVVTVGAANAEIASKTYVDDQVGTRATTASVTALTSTVTGQGERLTAAEGEIDTLQANSATKTELAGKQDKALIPSAQYNANKENDTSYPSVKAVADAITAVSGNVSGVTDDVAELQGTVTGLQEDVTDLQDTKQDKNMGAEAANKIVTTDGTGNITTSDNIAASKVTGLAEVATSGAYADLSGTPTLGALAAKNTVSATEIDANAVTTAKILDKNVTKAKLADDVQASLTAADSALQEADLADYAKTADVASTYETKENATATYETKANATATYETKANATATYETKTNAAATYATKEEIADMATTTALAGKQDKTDNTLATTAKTVVGAINEVNTAVGAAQDAADAAQTDATQAIADAATAQGAAEAAQETADGAIPKPEGECNNPTNKCVLTWNNSAYEWEVVAR